MWAWVRSVCTPASPATARTASLSSGPCGTSFPASHSSAPFDDHDLGPSILLLSSSDSLSGLFFALLGVYLFSPPSPQNYIFSSAFSFILSLALTLQNRFHILVRRPGECGHSPGTLGIPILGRNEFALRKFSAALRIYGPAGGPAARSRGGGTAVSAAPRRTPSPVSPE